MRRLFFIGCVLALAARADAAVGLSATTSLYNHATSSSTSINDANMTVQGGDAMLLVGLLFSSTNPSVTAVKWDNAGTPQTMTLVPGAQKNSNTGSGRVEFYCLDNPTAGNKTMHVDWTNASELVTYMWSFTGTASGCGASAFPHVQLAQGTGSGATASSGAFVSATGNYTVSIWATDVGSFSSPSQAHSFSDTATSIINAYGEWDPGAASMTHTWSVAGTNNFAAIALDIAVPGGAAVPCSISLLGVGRC